jgi:hypothetical protein
MGLLETPEKNGRRLRQAMPAALDLSPLGLRELSRIPRIRLHESSHV